MTPAELAAARWFRSKQHEIEAITETDRAALTPAADLVVVEVSYRDAPQRDRYLLLLAGGREPVDGSGAWRGLAIAMRGERTITGSSGRFVGEWTGAVALDATQAERRLNVEQSNTSVVIGERVILKLYRLLEPGDNPDLEISAFLTDVGFVDTPELAGSLVYHSADGWSAAAAMLQAFVPSVGDGWTAMLAALARGSADGVEMAAAIGRLTAELHEALASRSDDPAFPARAATVAETAAWRASAERQLAQAVTAVSGEAHRRLVELAPDVRARFADTFGAAAGEARVTRVHGDYHLGQLLARRDGGFSVVDFEGEPARPLVERRELSSPLRDVAGMLRSLDYAARTAERAAGLDAERWLAAARAAFLDAYGPTDPALLAAFELEKACYEVRYEASNRPDWLWLPLAAVERLAR